LGTVRNPAFIGSNNKTNGDVDELIGQGWRPLGINNSNGPSYGFIS
jgi:hypothetical protein